MRPKSAGNIRPLTPWRHLNSSAFCGLIAAFEDYALYWLWLTIRRAIAVGYMTDGMASSTSENKYNMMSVPFEAVDGKGISLNEIKFANQTVNTAFTAADRVMFWKPDIQDYEQYYHWGYQNFQDQIPPVWKKVGTDTLYDTDHPEGIAPGTVFWYYSQVTASSLEQAMTVSGQVPGDPILTFDITHKAGKGKSTYYFIANPFPSNANIAWNDSDVIWGAATPNSAFTAADRIMIWDASIQDYVQYYLWGYAGFEEQVTPLWKKVGTDTLFSEDYKDGLPAGTGFWYYAQEEKSTDKVQTVTFKSPLK